MIVPSIDLAGGQAVQLVQGEQLAIEAGDPGPLADRFGRIGEVAVIDLDAAKGEGSNAPLIKPLLARAPCRVGGGIRDYDTAVSWLDAGAEKIIVGTAATPEFLRRLPRDRVIAALDHRAGEIVDQGWRRKTGRSLETSIARLRDVVGGFLVTFVAEEGRMTGLPLDGLESLVRACGDAHLTIAGGTNSTAEIARADALGADVQVGMALYSGAMDLADAFAAPLRSDRKDGLWPTIVADEHGGVLGLAYSNMASLRKAVQSGEGVYWSRSRNQIWRKGATSGNVQQLCRVLVDCDRDALCFIVRQHGSGFCHLNQRTCFGNIWSIASLESTISARRQQAPDGSYTKRLFEDRSLLNAKLLEEAGELADADQQSEVIWEAADLFYFLMTAMARSGVTLADVESELHRRARIVSRRPGDAKSAPRTEAQS